MNCTTCALTIEKQVKKIDGVKEVQTALMLNKIFIEYEESKISIMGIMQTIERAGYSSYLARKDFGESAANKTGAVLKAYE